MARLGRQHLLLLANAYLKRLPKVKLTANWRVIYRELEVGELDGREQFLYFGPGDTERLRQGVLALMGLDLRALDFNVDRMTMSATSHHEKLAKIRPEAEYLLLKFIGFATDPFALSAFTSLRVPIAEAHTYWCKFRVEAILLVENLDVFDVIHQARLPQELTHVMVIYRGSGTHSSTAVRHFLQLMAGKLPIIAFTDLDPAGLQIAHTLTGVSHWLVAQLVLTAPAELLAMAQINSSSDFDKQANQASYLCHVDDQLWHRQWRDIGHWIVQHRISIKQQHLLSHGLELVLVPSLSNVSL
ncbi:MAG: DUF7281 domain-containing protein [Shewanella sp.]